MDSGDYFTMPRSQAGFTMSTENDSFSSEREFKEPERRKLIIDILKRLGPTNSHFVSPALLAFLWLSDLCCLKDILQSVEDAVLGTSMVLNAAIRDSDILATWSSRSFEPGARAVSSPSFPGSETSSDPPKKRRKGDSSLPPSPKKENQSRQTVKLRDRKCVITNATAPTVSTYIVPYSYNSLIPDKRFRFWWVLRTFWGEEKAKEWQQLIEEETTESPENQFLLCPNADEYWNGHLFAIEPLLVTDDRKELKARFHWLWPRGTRQVHGFWNDLESLGSPSLRPVGDTAKGRGNEDGENIEPNLRLFDCETLQVISSGEEFSFKTDDPETFPLPSFSLLQLQWLLHRVQALAAADGYFDDGEEDDDCGMGHDAFAPDTEISPYLLDDHFEVPYRPYQPYRPSLGTDELDFLLKCVHG